jgi:hypothetical protein
VTATRQLLKRKRRTSGIQVAQVALAAQLDAWRDQLTANEYAVLVDLHGRRLDNERERLARNWRAAAEPMQRGGRATARRSGQPVQPEEEDLAA